MGAATTWVTEDVLKMAVDVTAEMAVEITPGDVRLRG